MCSWFCKIFFNTRYVVSGHWSSTFLSFIFVVALISRAAGFLFFPLDPTFSQPLTCLLVSDPTDQLRLHSPRAERQKPLRVLLPCGASRLVPGPGHGGHCQGHGLELRFHAGLWGQLRREWCWRLPADIERSRYVCLAVWRGILEREDWPTCKGILQNTTFWGIYY